DDDTDFSLTVTATATEAATVAGGGELTDANNVATTSFTVDVTVDPVSDTPSVVVEDAAGKEDLGAAADQIASIPAPTDGSIPLSITLTTGEGGTEDGWVVLSGYPAGVTFSVGAAAVDGWRVDLADLGALAINGLPADSDGDFSITVTPWSQDGTATPVAGADGTIDVLIDAVADIPALTLDGGAGNSSASGDENTAIALPDVAAGLQDMDGSETLSISIGGVPTGATLSDGLNNFVGDGSDANVTGWDLANLTITPATDDDSDFTLTVTATATEGAAEAAGVELQDDDNSASTSFNIDVTVNAPPPDDGPTAVADGPDYISEPLDTHAVFVIDTSASLSQPDLALMEEALKNLATTLFTQNPEGTKITLIDFDTHASFIGGGDGTFTTLASVLTALDNLDSSSGGATNYYDALNLTRTINFEPGYEKAIYFISDGQPTQGNTQGGINDFNNWVTNDLGGADVYAVGVGSDAQNSIYLGQIDNTTIDNNNDPDPGDPYLYVASPGDLDASLVTSNVHLEGNVLDNDVPGTDPLAAVPIVSIAYKGVTYDLGDGADPNVTVDGNVLTLDSDFGVLTLDFETGEYSYIANTDISNSENELFSYTIADTGGSTSTAVLTIQITPDSSYTGTPGADDIIGGTGNDYIAGQAGDDTLFGGNGDDRFVFQNASTDGHDVIQDFGANGDGDVIDLSALFDELGIAPADRADHVVFNEAGGDTTITVTDGSDATIAGFSILVESASLDATDITNHKIVVDES
ncbi:MAG: VWA domain-containing protein, partial [Sneathiella sp.]|nr:VWA domain-containing protein [Sneathiella sp.]